MDETSLVENDTESVAIRIYHIKRRIAYGSNFSETRYKIC